MVSTHKFGPYTIDDDQQKMIVFTDQGLVGGYILDNLIILAGTWEGTEEEISGTITFGQHYKRKITTGPLHCRHGWGQNNGQYPRA